MARMTTGARTSTRFNRAVFRGRCRRNLLAGLAICVLAGLYATWAAGRFARRGADAHVFDHPLVQLADSMIAQPAHLRTIQPQNNRELYLVTVISDQRDVLVGMTVLVLRLFVVLTAAGWGLVLLTAGATEWEVRSDTAPVGRDLPEAK